MFGKHFEAMYKGSMVGAGADVFAVWGYVIATTVDSTVELNEEYLAAVLGMSTERVAEAIARLQLPDSKSRTETFEGRRLVKEGPFQYHVPSWEKWNAIRSEEARREYQRAHKRAYRERKKQQRAVNDGQQMSTDVHGLSTMSTNTEADSEANTDSNQTLAIARAPAKDIFAESFVTENDELPESWKPTAKNRATATRKGIDCDEEFELYAARCRAMKRVCGDWEGDFEVWLLRAKKFAKTSQNGSQGPSRAIRETTNERRMREQKERVTRLEAEELENSRTINVGGR
jgi:hypothetical protein